MSDEFQKAVDAAAWQLANPKRHKSYRKAACPLCGRVIGESAGSGLNGNLRKHIAACERKQNVRKQEA